MDSTTAVDQPAASAALTHAEKYRLEQLEGYVEAGLKQFCLVGQALLTIRDDRLYRATHGTFEAYLQERWDLSERRGYQLIDAAEVVENLKNFAGEAPQRESHTVPLTRLPAAEQPDAWAEAVETAPNGRVTAAHVATVVDRRLGKPEPTLEPPPGPEPPDIIEAEFDEQGSEETTELEAVYTGASAAYAEEQTAALVPTQAHPNRRTDDRQTWATPQRLFDLLDVEFSFTLDPCAEPETAKCVRYFTAEQDGLAQSWADQVVFCNPPYADKARWVEKAYREAAEDDATVVLLIPVAMGTDLTWTYCRRGEIRFLRGRLRFDDGDVAAPFDSMLVVFYPGCRSIDAGLRWYDDWPIREEEVDHV